jgi:6-pyruvoyltetrahydropterin/6-carboxytetrahydropterin synthase
MIPPLFEITKAATFDAAHSLPTGPRAEYRRLHGHSFRVEATIRGQIEDGAVGWVEDLGALDEALRAVADELDHGHLNEVAGLESPTLEHLCMHFARRLKSRFPALARVTVSRPTVGESCAMEV